MTEDQKPGWGENWDETKFTEKPSRRSTAGDAAACPAHHNIASASFTAAGKPPAARSSKPWQP